MHYSATFKHIDQNFGFDGDITTSWSKEYSEEAAFILDLNRMAIASSQYPVVDFPEVEVRCHSVRVTVRSIRGQLYFDDLHSQNRKNLKVVPVEVVRLIEGQPLDEVFKRDPSEEEFYVPPKPRRRRRNHWLTRVIALVGMFVILGYCSKVIWRDIREQPRLHHAPKFLPTLSEAGEVLRKYADVYVDEYREGAMLFELKENGEFTRYEMWYSGDRNAFILIPVDRYMVQVGLHAGKTCMLAGEFFLLIPSDEESIDLLGVNFKRHHGDLSSIGEVLEVRRP